MRSRSETQSPQQNGGMQLEDIRTRVFGGYDKKEIRRYISAILQENEEESKTQKGRIQELEKSKDSLLAEIKEMGAHQARQQEIYMQTVAAHNSRIAELSTQLSAKGQAEATYQMKLEQLEAAIQRQAERNEQEYRKKLEQAERDIHTRERLAVAQLAEAEQVYRKKQAEADAEAVRIQSEADRYLQRFAQDLRTVLAWAEARFENNTPEDHPGEHVSFPAADTPTADTRQSDRRTLPELVPLRK